MRFREMNRNNNVTLSYTARLASNLRDYIEKFKFEMPSNNISA